MKIIHTGKTIKLDNIDDVYSNGENKSWKN